MTAPAPPFTRHGIARGARQGLPLAVSSCAYGLIFGALAQTVGLRLAETTLMSVTVSSGAAQFVVVGLWTTPPVLASVLMATLLVNLRHLLLGATLRRWFARSSRSQLYGSAFFLFDETWALTHREADTGGRDRGLLLGCGLVLWLAWVAGSALGYLAGGWVPDPTRWGLDFAATAVFLALLTGMWRGKRDLLPWLVAAAVALGAARWLPGQWYIVLGGLAGSICGVWRDAG
jgi:4-azaleucine resistance transporter AzlC